MQHLMIFNPHASWWDWTEGGELFFFFFFIKMIQIHEHYLIMHIGRVVCVQADVVYALAPPRPREAAFLFIYFFFFIKMIQFHEQYLVMHH